MRCWYRLKFSYSSKRKKKGFPGSASETLAIRRSTGCFCIESPVGVMAPTLFTCAPRAMSPSWIAAERDAGLSDGARFIDLATISQVDVSSRSPQLASATYHAQNLRMDAHMLRFR